MYILPGAYGHDRFADLYIHVYVFAASMLNSAGKEQFVLANFIL